MDNKKYTKYMCVSQAMHLIDSETATLDQLHSSFHDIEKLVEKAVSKSEYYLAHASTRLKNDLNFIKKIIIDKPHALFFADPLLRHNRNLCMLALEKDGTVLKFLNEDFKNDIEVVTKAVKQNSKCLHFASKELRNDKDLALMSLENSNESLESMPDKFKDDEDIMLKAVKINGVVLRFASNRLKANKSIVLAALISYPLADIYIDSQLKEEIGNNDPVLYLKSFLINERLQETIPNKDSNEKRKMKI